MTHHQVNSYQDALDYLYSFTDYEKKISYLYSPERFQLRRVADLLERLGNPHHQFRSVHIAGTKGKGSTAAMLASVLTAAGLRTGLYTSPHLHTFCERIRVDGQLIAREDVARLVREMIPIIGVIPELTTFEIITALAFTYFARQGTSFAVIEVGLGGRLDATNVIAPRGAAITSISLDHTQILGTTRAAIAREKAGIIKPGTPVVSAPQPPEAQAVIEAVCAERQAPLTLVGQDWTWLPVAASLDGQTFRVASDLPGTAELCRQTYRLPLLGGHQLLNATVAIAILHLLREQGVGISVDSIVQGLAQVAWPARFELLGREPTVIVDGAHNPKSAQQLRQTLDEFFPGRDVTLIFGVSADKDIMGILREWLPMARHIVVTQSSHPRAASVDSLMSTMTDLGREALVTADTERALDIALEVSKPGDVICASGSLFVAADVRLAWLRRNDMENAPLTDNDA